MRPEFFLSTIRFGAVAVALHVCACQRDEAKEQAIQPAVSQVPAARGPLPLAPTTKSAAATATAAPPSKPTGDHRNHPHPGGGHP
jgi:hypothetical protein